MISLSEVKHRAVVIIIFALTFCSMASTYAWTQEENPLSAKARLQPSTLSAGATSQLLVDLNLASGYHAYLDKFKLVLESPDDLKLDQFKIAPTVSFEDPFTHKTRQSIEGHANLKATLEIPNGFKVGSSIAHFKLTYQACTKDHCLFPKTISIEAAFSVGTLANVSAGEDLTNPVATVTIKNDQSGAFSADKFDFAQTLGRGAGSALLIVFFMGLLTSFTPCIYPMIPITLAILGTRTHNQSKLKSFSLSLIYVLGIATTYSLLGVAAAQTGAFFGSALGNVYVVTAIALVFTIMALSMYGVFELQVPAFLRNRLGTARAGSGLSGAYTVGLFAGVVASPCVGPVLVSILAHIAQTRNTLQGFVFLFTFALGMGVPFIVLGTSSSLLNRIPRAGRWMELTKFIFGSLMVAMALYYVYPIYPKWLFLALAGLAIAAVASFSGAFRIKSHSAVTRLQRGAMLSAFAMGLALIVFAGGLKIGVIKNDDDVLNEKYEKLSWQPYSLNATQNAASTHRPVLIDFSAEWCVACMELEHRTFTNERVRNLSQQFVLLKVDATEESKDLDVIKNRFGIIGLPTLIFIDSDGKTHSDLTLTGFEDADHFAQRMQQIH